MRYSTDDQDLEEQEAITITLKLVFLRAWYALMPIPFGLVNF